MNDPRGLHAGELVPGETIQNGDLAAGDKTLTIKSIEMRVLKDDDGKKRARGTVYFREDERGWVLNKTNVACLAKMFGEWSKDWIGKRVTLYRDGAVAFGRDLTGGIRVRGSPDITETLEIEIKHRQKKARKYVLTKTGNVAVGRVMDTLGATEKKPDIAALASAMVLELAMAMGGEDKKDEAKKALGKLTPNTLDAWLANGRVLVEKARGGREPGGEG